MKVQVELDLPKNFKIGELLMFDLDCYPVHCLADSSRMLLGILSVVFLLSIFIVPVQSSDNSSRNRSTKVARIMDYDVRKEQIFVPESYLKSRSDLSPRLIERMFKRSLPARNLKTLVLSIMRDRWARQKNINVSDSEVITLVDHRLQHLRDDGGQYHSPTPMSGFMPGAEGLRTVLEQDRDPDWVYDRQARRKMSKQDWMSANNWILNMFQFERIAQVFLLQDQDYLRRIKDGDYHEKFDLLRKAILAWKFHRHLFQKYGGLVRVAGSDAMAINVRPIGAFTDYLSDLRDNGKFEIYNRDIRNVFWGRLRARKRMFNRRTQTDIPQDIKQFKRPPWSEK